MANHKSAEKRARQSIKHKLRNKHYRSVMRTKIKNIRTLVKKQATDKIKDALNEATSVVQRLATKGIIHKNTASRYLSRMTRLVNTLKKK